VAGAKLLVTDQMPDERRKTRIKRPASHTTLDGSLFIPRVLERLQGDVDEVESWGLSGQGRPRICTDLHGSKSESYRRGFTRIFADQEQLIAIFFRSFFGGVEVGVESDGLLDFLFGLVFVALFLEHQAETPMGGGEEEEDFNEAARPGNH
jgi:hypothetical protein